MLFINGAVVQLGERGVRNAEVRGSNPLCSILFVLQRRYSRKDFTLNKFQ